MSFRIPNFFNAVFLVAIFSLTPTLLAGDDWHEGCGNDGCGHPSRVLPKANAGFDRTADVGGLVTLDGSGSVSPREHLLSYHWRIVSQPAGSATVLNNPSAIKPSFNVDQAGDYVLELRVASRDGRSAPDQVIISTDNTAPIADPDTDRFIAAGTRVVLNGGGSSDFDGDALTYKWSLIRKPRGSAATLDDTTALRPAFVADRPGDYLAKLVVTDGERSSAPARVRISTKNLVPVPEAGPNFTVSIGSRLRVDPDGTSDADGDRLLARWSLIARPDGSTAKLKKRRGRRPHVIPDKAGGYVLQLAARDEVSPRVFDTMTVTTGNTVPVAKAGVDQVITAGAAVSLDGAGSSDVDGDELNYRWALIKQPQGSTAVLDKPTRPRPSFVADLPGDYVAQLIVDDGREVSPADTVLITNGNVAPIADAGPDQTITGFPVDLDGSGSSDANGDPLSFRWNKVLIASRRGIDGEESDSEDDESGSFSLSASATIAPSLVLSAGDDDDDEDRQGGHRPGQVLVQLIVNDGTTDSVADTVLLSLTNSRPLADAGPDRNVVLGDLVMLDGGASSDFDHDPLSFRWALLARPEGSGAVLADASTTTPSFTADLPGTYIAQLIVNDGRLDSRPDTVVISITNQPPIADAGPDQVVRTRGLARLDGSGSSDPDGDALDFAWVITSQPAGSTTTLSGAGSINASLVPDLPGNYIVELVVSDSASTSAPDSVTITATGEAPIAEAGADQIIQPGEAAMLDGSTSSDPDGQPLSFAWRFTALPGGSAAVLSGADTATPNFTADLAGIYIAELTVSDGAFESKDTVAVRAEAPSTNNPPVLDPIGNQTVALGTTLVLTLTAGDADGDNLSFSSTPLPLPSGASLDAASGVFRYTPQPTELGGVALTFSVSDGLAFDSESIAIAVTDSPAGPTRLSGQVLDAVDLAAGNITPVAGATVSVLGASGSAITDAAGNFTLNNLSGGNPLIVVNGSTANQAPDGSAYASLRQSVDVVSGVTNTPAGPLALARIDAGSVTTVDPATTTVVQNPTLDVALTIPPGSAQLPAGTPFTGEVSVSDAIPDVASLPDFLDPCQLITVQPAGLIFNPAAQLSFPNLDNLAPGSEVDLWFLNPNTGDFSVVGVGTVSANGSTIETTSGGIPASGLVTAAAPAPAAARSSDDNGFNFTPTTLADGNLSTSFSLPSYNSLGRARTRTFVYNSTLAAPAPILAAESTLLARGGIPGLVEAELEVGGNRVAGPVFTTTGKPVDPADPGLSEDVDEVLRTALQFDASDLPTGSYPYRFVSTGNFGCTRIATATAGQVFVRNETESPFGAGWTLEELQRLFPQDDGSIVLTEGNGTTLRFEAFKPVDSTSGAVVEVIDPPQSVRPNVLESDDNLIVFNERRNFALPMPVTLNAVNPRTFSNNNQLQNRPLPAGAIINSYFAHFDIVGTAGDLTRSGTVTFDEEILGVILLDADLNASDPILGRDDVAYPEPGESDLRGIEFGANDRITIGPNRRSLTITSRTTTGADQFRVVTLGDTDSGDIIASFFDVDGEDWTFSGDGTGGPFYEAAGGNPDGHIRVKDKGDGIPWFFQAPAKFLGDVSRFYNGRLSFDLITNQTVVPFDEDDVRLVGAGLTLAFDTPYNPLSDWTRYSIAILREDSGWIVSGENRPPTRTEFLAVLADLQVLLIRGEFSGRSGDVGRLDNVVLLRLPTAPQLADFRAPAGDFSTLTANPDGTFTRRLKDGTQLTFDADGLMTTVADRNGNTTNYAYDPTGNLTTITDPAGLETTFGYTAGALSSITDPAGRTTGFLVDSFGNLTSTTNADGTLKRFVYDNNDQLISEVSERGFVTQHNYGFAGQFLGSGFPDGGSVAAQISKSLGLADLGIGLGTEDNPALFGRPANQVAELVDANGNLYRIRINNYGSPVEIDDPVGRLTTLSRNTDNQVTIMTVPSDGELPDGTIPGQEVTEFDYDDRGNVTALREAAGTILQRDTRFQYEPTFNRTTAIADPSATDADPQCATAGVTCFRYDGNGNLEQVTAFVDGAAIFTQTSTYDSRGLELTRTDANNNLTQFGYNTIGQLETLTDAETNQVKLGYDGAGNITSRTEGLGTLEARITTFTYDEINRVETETDGEGGITKRRYDSSGNEIETEDSTGVVTTRTFDERNRLVEEDDKTLGLLVQTYDLNGNVRTSTNALGDTIELFYDDVNRVVRTHDALNNDRLFAYDAEDNLVTITDARQNMTTLVYDLLGRNSRQINSLGEITRFEYDSRDNPTRTIDAKGQTLDRKFDELSRLSEITLIEADGATIADVIQFGYDANGNRVTAQDGDSSLSFVFDKLNRVVRASTVINADTVQPAVVLTSVFDPVGNRTALRHGPDDLVVDGTWDFAHDATGRLTTLVPPGVDPLRPISLSYDPEGRLTRVGFPNQIVSEIEYGLNGRPGRVAHLRGTSEFAAFGYGYDAEGKITSISEAAGVRSFAYDKAQQLIAGGFDSAPEIYEFDPQGNRVLTHLSATHSHDAANRLTSDDDFSYTYDANGNLETKTEKSTGLTTTYVWDVQNRLVRINHTDGTSTSYRYDPAGRRIEKDVDGSVTRYVYDQTNIVLEYDGSNSLVARYSHGLNLDQPLAQERNGQRFYYQVDHLGSVRRLTDEAGNVVNSYDYDSFGRFEVRFEAVPNPYTFTAREFDSESGLYFYRARYYDPEIGRFLSEDPIGMDGDDLNLYRYAQNNPVILVDPDGLGPLTSLSRIIQQGKKTISAVVRLRNNISTRVEDFLLRQFYKLPPSTHFILLELRIGLIEGRNGVFGTIGKLSHAEAAARLAGRTAGAVFRFLKGLNNMLGG